MNPAKLLAIAILLLPAAAAHGQGLTDITASSGLLYDHVTDPNIPIGGGAAWVDLDADGDDDVYAIQGTGCNLLYLNDGNGGFSPVADAAGAGDCDGAGHGAWPADYDNDGDQDVYIGNLAGNRLYRNLLVETGELAFEDATEEAGLADDGAYNTGTAAWGDYDEDGHLDLFVGNHMAGFPITCFIDQLWHANGDGTFTDVAAATGIDLSGVADKAGCALAAAFTDYDRDNDVDLLIVNDFGGTNGVPNRMFRNDGSDGNGGWIFTDVSAATGLDYFQAGMGVAIADINGDGFFDYYSSDAGKNEFGLSNGDLTYAEVATQTGVEASDAEIWGAIGLVSWGTLFYDLNHDGREDLVVCNGGAPQDIFPGFFGGTDYIHQNPCYIYRNEWPSIGGFVEEHAALGASTHTYYRGAYASDIDDDGDMDLLFGNQHGLISLYRNDHANGNWLKVRTTGRLGNRDAIGTLVEAKVGRTRFIREINAGSTFMGRNTLTAHFGLATQSSVDLTATFPSGVTQEYLFLAPNQTLEVTEPRVTATFNQDRKRASAGQPLVVAVTVTNHDAVMRERTLWFVEVTPAGETVVVAATTQTLEPGASVVVPVRLSNAANAGVTRYGARLGSVGTGVTHRDHLLVFAQPGP